MIEKELKKRAKDYPKRHIVWTQLQLSQFGYSVNLFTTIGIGFLAYLIVKYSDTEFVNKLSKCDFILYVGAIGFCFFSTLIGISSILCRLYDLRLTRHLFSITRKYSGKELLELVEIFEKRIDPNLKIGEICKVFFCTLFCEKVFTVEKDHENFKVIKEKFISIRERSLTFSGASWLFHKFQMLLFIIAAIVYGVSVLCVK